MKITIELTDRQISAIKDALKISYSDFLAVSEHCSPASPPSQLDYAIRILRAREALELSNVDAECVSDVQNIPPIPLPEIVSTT